MFAKLYTLALAASLVSAITFNSIQNSVNGGTITVTWTASSDDPPYISLELLNPSFNSEYAVANNIQTSLGSYTFPVPQVPNSQYQLQAIATNNVNQIYTTSNPFSIGAPSSSSSSAASSISGTTISELSTTSTVSTSTGSTPSATPTTTIPLSSASSSASSSSSASPSPSSFTSGAASFKLVGVVPAAVLALSAVAGAAMVF